MEKSAAEETINELAKEFMGENPGIEYGEAFTQIMKSNSQLAEDYLFSEEKPPEKAARMKASFAEKADASVEIDAQARFLALKSNVSYERALDCVLHLPINKSLAATYLGN